VWGVGAPAGLDQFQLSGPFYSRPPIIDVELAEDALGMCADGTQADDELTSDLWTGKFGREQPKNLQLALAERLD
jgi:hypothetical protein